MINYADLRELVIRPALLAVGLWSAAAENLLVGTAFVESTLGDETRLKQIRGPALGIYQIEPATHDDQWFNFLKYQKALREKVLGLIPAAAIREDGGVDHSLLITDLRYATIIARIKYRRSKMTLPMPEDIEGLGRMWKTVYNTSMGAGTAAKFVQAYPG